MNLRNLRHLRMMLCVILSNLCNRPSRMNRTDTNHPSYYHRVVDCQWACPAHTNVPEYIRLIAQGRYSDAYLVNRQSTCFRGFSADLDRPCGRRAGGPASTASRSRSAG